VRELGVPEDEQAGAEDLRQERERKQEKDAERRRDRARVSSPANFREQFRRLTGVAPQSYRNTFKDRKAG